MKLQIKNLSISYGEKVAIQNLDLDIESGKLLCLLGPSGCGKSTILNAVAGFLTPKSGTILFDDVDMTKVRTEKREIGMVFQNYALYPHMTLFDNIAFPLKVQHLSKGEIRDRVEAVAKLTKIEDILKRKPGEISGGQQQRVAISRALIKDPKLLLLDEPLSNLDARLRLEMREEIRRIQQETKTTTIFVTHDQEEALSISDRIVLLKDGIIQQDDVPYRLYTQPNNVFVAKFLGTPPINILHGKYTDGKMCLDGDGMRIPAQGYKDGDSYLLGIRCEDIQLCREQDAQFHLRHIASELIGKEAVVRASTGSQDVRFLVPHDRLSEIGDVIPAVLNTPNVHVFDAHTRQRTGGLQ